MSLSVVIPCYNEEKTIITIIDEVEKALKNAKIDFEIIVTDDGSTDDSLKKLKRLKHKIKLITQSNMGKGKAVQNAIKFSKKKFIIVQDADLEYCPKDIIKMYSCCRKDTVVYGSRLKGAKLKSYGLRKILGLNRNYNFSSYVANLIFTIFHLILYQKLISDTLTGYKLYPKKFFDENKIITSGFETDHEITAKLLKSKYKIVEVPIKFNPRSVEEGKKIGIKDFFIGTFTIFYFRILK